jgi:putative flippase GtrA
MHRQWVTFLLANSLGSVLYLGTSSFLVAKFAFFHHYLVLASVAGTCASMFVNFNASRHLVFK